MAKVALAATAAGVVILSAWVAFQDRAPVRAEVDSATVGAEAVAASEANPAAGAVPAVSPPGLEGAGTTGEVTSPEPFPQATGTPSAVSAEAAAGGGASTEAGLAERLSEAEARQARAAQRVAALRARQESAEIETAREYERLLDEIKAAYAELDRARADVQRLRGGLE